MISLNLCKEENTFPFVIILVNDAEKNALFVNQLIADLSFFDTSEYSDSDFQNTLAFLHNCLAHLPAREEKYNKIFYILKNKMRSSGVWKITPEKEGFRDKTKVLLISFKEESLAKKYKMLAKLGPEYAVLE